MVEGIKTELPSEAISFWSSMLETDEKIFRLAVAGAYALGVDEALADRATRYHMAKSIIG